MQFKLTMHGKNLILNLHQPHNLPRTFKCFTHPKKLVANDVHKVSEQLKKRVVTPPLQQILMNSVGNGTHLGTIDPMMNNNNNNVDDD